MSIDGELNYGINNTHSFDMDIVRFATRCLTDAIV